MSEPSPLEWLDAMMNAPSGPDELLWAVGILVTRKTGGTLDMSHTVRIMRAPTEEQVKVDAMEAAKKEWPAGRGWGGWHVVACTVLPPVG